MPLNTRTQDGRRAYPVVIWSQNNTTHPRSAMQALRLKSYTRTILDRTRILTLTGFPITISV